MESHNESLLMGNLSGYLAGLALDLTNEMGLKRRVEIMRYLIGTFETYPVAGSEKIVARWKSKLKLLESLPS